MRVIFAGTPDFAVPVLHGLHHGGYQIVCVLTQPDRPAGRGRKAAAGPIKRYALAHDIPCLQPATLNVAAADVFARHPADVLIVVAYGLIVPPAMLEAAPLGAINVHASLLPRWRGAAPIARAIEAGDQTTGVSIMRMDAGLDTGPVFATRRVDIEAEDNAASLHDKLAHAGAALLLDCLPRIACGELAAVAQDHALATYAHKLKKTEGLISWSAPAADIVNKIRAFNPWPVAYTYHRGQRIRVWQAAARAEDCGSPGGIARIDAGGILVCAGHGGVLLGVLQRDGGRALPAAEFLHGYPLSAGDSFEEK